MSIIKKSIIFFLIFFATNIFGQNNIQNFTIKDGLPSDIIYDIKQDKIGYLWIATAKGLVKFDGNNFTQIHKFKTTTIFIDNANTVYSGLENGLFIKDVLKERIVKCKKVLKITVFENEVFLATIEGIYSVKNKKLQLLKINSTVDFSIINSIIPYKNILYFSSSKGLFKLHKILKKNNLIKLNNKEFISLEKFQNKIVAATLENKIMIIEQDSIVEVIETLNDISSIKKLKNEIWVTSKSNGIEVFTLPSFSFKQKINKYNSLQTNTIYNVFRDDKKSTYIASNKGLYFFTKKPSEIKEKVKPIIYFENLQINHKNADSLLLKEKFNLSHSKNNIAILFKTVDLLNPKKIQYRYQLNDVFSDWSTNNRVQFPSLNPGKYTLRVQSKIGHRKSTIKSISFHIDNPLHKETWFILLVIIIFLISSYIYLHYYIEKINTTNRVKLDRLKLQNRLLTLEHKALQLQMNPHFIFNVLNGIKALGNSGKVNELNTTVSKFSVLLRGILNNSRKEEITLKEEIELLKNYIELEQRMSSKTFTYTINANLNNIDPEEILIPTMLIQPFVENSIKHAFHKNIKGSIIIHFKIKHLFLYCSITDNGIGITKSTYNNTNKTHKSVALNVSKERLNHITPKNCFKIYDLNINKEAYGTKVSFRIPLKTDY